ncbi:MAG: NifB/NifX family molybdenum-iron cluster-binding protein [Acidobacteriota bacterium]
MKIAFSTSGQTLDAPLDGRFGRAPRFLVYDVERADFKIVDNTQAFDAMQGAGVQAAETVTRAGAGCVVTGHCGPKAFRVLSAAGIEVYTTGAASVAEALELFRSGKLVPATGPDVDGHWA